MQEVKNIFQKTIRVIVFFQFFFSAVTQAQALTDENPEQQAQQQLCSGSYRYCDTFSTLKADTDSYFHSHIVNSLPDIFLSGVLKYEHPGLAFYSGFLVESDPFLFYRFPLKSAQEIITRGVVTVYIYTSGNGYFFPSVSFDGVSWVLLDSVVASGKYEYIFSPPDSTTQIFLRFIGDEILLDHFCISLALDSTSIVKPETGTDIPNEFALFQNYSNPFYTTTTLRYQLSRESWVSLNIYNLQGQLIRVLVADRVKGGTGTATWDGRDTFGYSVANGVYLYRLLINNGEWTNTKKMTLLR